MRRGRGKEKEYYNPVWEKKQLQQRECAYIRRREERKSRLH